MIDILPVGNAHDRCQPNLGQTRSDSNRFRTPLRVGRQTFVKKWLKPKSDAEGLSLDEWVEAAEPGSSDLLLQMDIEGAEYANLEAVSQQTLSRFRVIVLELHGLSQLRHPNRFLQEKGAAIESLRRDHDVVHLHPNNCCGQARIGGSVREIPSVLEVTLLRKDRIRNWSADGLPFRSPHPDDIGWNVASRPPLFLGPEFFESDKVFAESLLRRSIIVSLWHNQQQLQALRAGAQGVGLSGFL